MFFSKKKKAKKSALDIIEKLRNISAGSGGTVVDGLVQKLNTGRYNPDRKDIDARLNTLVDKLLYNMNDNNAKTCNALLKYIEKLADSRNGFGNYYEKIKKDAVEEQLQEYDILMNECLDKAERALFEYENEQDETKREMHEYAYKSAILESRQIAKMMHDLSTRVRNADLEQMQRIFDAQSATDDVEADAIKYGFLHKKIGDLTEGNIDVNRVRLDRLGDVEMPVSKKNDNAAASVKYRTIIEED
ncbi:MAG: hypothetical protein FWC70_10220 [Defluviitaleaceae bacterium]|nr:hypothetical protein [Defluviitaleaceae bacterium]